MIKKIKNLKLFFLFVFIILVFLLSATYKRYSLKQIIALVEKTAGVKFNPKPRIVFLSEKAFSKKIDDIVMRDLKKNKFEKEVFLLRILGLIKNNIDMYKIKKSLYNKNVAGFFDEEGKGNEIYIKGDKTFYYNKIKTMLLFHELWHIIQKQKYKIDDIIPDRIEYDDKSLAILSFLEGDAIIHMEKISNYNLVIDSPDITIEDAINFSSDDNIRTYPRIIREQLIFPYVYGPRFIRYIKNKFSGDYSSVYKNPPKSSIEIIFPELYPLTLKKNPFNKRKNSYLSGSLGIFFINLILKEKGVLSTYDFDLFKEWRGDYYIIDKDKSVYSFKWSIFINGDKIDKILKLLRRGFPKTKILKRGNQINFIMEGKKWK